MKKLLILALTMVSVTSFAGNLKVSCSPLAVENTNTQNEALTGRFSGELTLTTQEDEVVLADSIKLSLQSQNSPDRAQSLELKNLYGTQQQVQKNETSQDQIISIALKGGEDTAVPVNLIINLGVKGLNSRLALNQDTVYVSSCAVISENSN